MDGCRSSAICLAGRMPYETMVTEANIAKTLRKPRMVARPTSSRRIRVPRLHAGALDAEEHEHRREHRPVHLAEHRPGVHAAADVVGEDVGLQIEHAENDEEMIGSTLATVTIRFIAAASFTPRRMKRKKAHRPTEDSRIARSVSPSPSAGAIAPIVDMSSTQYVTLPTQALAQ